MVIQWKDITYRKIRIKINPTKSKLPHARGSTALLIKREC